MPDIIVKKDGTDYPFQTMPLHYPADRVYLDGDVTKTVQGAIDEINSKVDKGSVSFLFTTSMTYGTILTSLYALADKSKITLNSKITILGLVYNIVVLTGSREYAVARSAGNSVIKFTSNVASFIDYNWGGTTTDNTSVNAWSNGTAYLYY